MNLKYDSLSFFTRRILTFAVLRQIWAKHLPSISIIAITKVFELADECRLSRLIPLLSFSSLFSPGRFSVSFFARFSKWFLMWQNKPQPQGGTSSWESGSLTLYSFPSSSHLSLFKTKCLFYQHNIKGLECFTVCWRCCSIKEHGVQEAFAFVFHTFEGYVLTDQISSIISLNVI